MKEPINVVGTQQVNRFVKKPSVLFVGLNRCIYAGIF